MRAVDRIAGGGIPLGSSGIPFILPSSGSMGNNGALTGLTALDQTYAKCFMWFAAAQIAAGSAAGWYYTEMSTTQAGTVFNNTYSSGIPELPSKTAFVTTGPGAFTGATSATTAISLATPPGFMGRNGWLEIESLHSQTSNANAKNAQHKLGASVLGSAGVLTSSGQGRVNTKAFNAGDQAAQYSQTLTALSSAVSESSAVATAIDTSAASTVSILMVHSGAATDNVVLNGWRVTYGYQA